MIARIATGLALALAAGPIVIAQNAPYQNYGTQPQPAGQQAIQPYYNGAAVPANRPIVTPAATRQPNSAGARIGDSYVQPQPGPQPVANSVAQGCGSCDGRGAGCDGAGWRGAGACDSSGCGTGGCDASGFSGRGCGGCDGRGGCDSGACGCDPCCSGSCCDRYFRVFGGWVGMQNLNVDVPQVGAFDLTANDGWGIGASRGRYLTCNLRWESEFAYRNNTMEDVIFGTVVNPISGNINTFSGQQLLIRELSRVNLAGVTPYVGVGGGGCYIDADFGGNAISDFSFSYTGLVGLQRQLGGRARAFVEYRYFGTGEIQIEGPAGERYDTHYSTNNIFAGLMLCR